jgi:hypothetical protein
VAVVEKAGERVDVCPTSSASSNHLIVLHRNIVFGVVEGSVGLDDKRERQFTLLEKR